MAKTLSVCAPLIPVLSPDTAAAQLVHAAPVEFQRRALARALALAQEDLQVQDKVRGLRYIDPVWYLGEKLEELPGSLREPMELYAKAVRKALRTRWLNPLKVPGEQAFADAVGDPDRGQLRHMSLSELRNNLILLEHEDKEKEKERLVVSGVSEDVQEWMLRHKRPQTIQLASQANALEMATPMATPNLGLGPYLGDRTQGPMVALATLFDTFWRNMTACDFNALASYGVPAVTIGPCVHKGVHVRNGYVRVRKDADASALLERCVGSFHDNLVVSWVRGARMVGAVDRDGGFRCLQGGPRSRAPVHHLVCSWAVPVGTYGNLGFRGNLSFQTLVLELLELQYEAAVLVALQRDTFRPPRAQVLLTQVGEGAFGLPSGTFLDVVRRLAVKYTRYPLDIIVNNFDGRFLSALSSISSSSSSSSSSFSSYYKRAGKYSWTLCVNSPDFKEEEEQVDPDVPWHSVITEKQREFLLPSSPDLVFFESNGLVWSVSRNLFVLPGVGGHPELPPIQTPCFGLPECQEKEGELFVTSDDWLGWWPATQGQREVSFPSSHSAAGLSLLRRESEPNKYRGYFKPDPTVLEILRSPLRILCAGREILPCAKTQGVFLH